MAFTERRRRQRMITAALGVGVALAVPCRAATITKGPYLQHLAADRVEVRFELAADGPATLDFGAPGSLGSHVEDRNSRAFHAIAVTGLKPGTRYQYRVRSGDAKSETGDFVTAPADDADAPFAFAVYGDNRTDGAAHASVVKALRTESFDFLLNSGDYVQVGGEPGLWQGFFDIEAPLLRDKCVFACVGNHELFNDAVAAAYTRYFGPSGDSKLFGSVRWGSARVFLLNAFEDWANGEERAWLERTLEAADAEPGLKWRFAVLHHSPWSGGPHGDNKRLLAAHIPELLAKHHVDLVIAGHDHIYERGDSGGLKYLISGGGGAPLYRDLHAEASTRKIEASYHYVLVDVNRDAAKLVAKRVDGSIIESCGFAHAGWDCDAPAAPPDKQASTTAPAPPTTPPTTARPSSSCGCRLGEAPPAAWAFGTGVAAVAAFALRRRRRRRLRAK